MATDEEKERVFQAIELAVDIVVSEVVEGHYEALTQEPQLTSKIAGAIEHTIKKMDIGDLNVKVEVRDFPAQGRGALVRKGGRRRLYLRGCYPREPGRHKQGHDRPGQVGPLCKGPPPAGADRQDDGALRVFIVRVGLRSERRDLLSCWRLSQSSLRRRRWPVGRLTDCQWLAMRRGRPEDWAGPH